MLMRRHLRIVVPPSDSGASDYHSIMRVYLKAPAVESALARRNLTKTAFARLCGLNRTHLSDLLAGRTRPGPQTRRRLLEVLSGEFDDYFETDEGEAQLDEGAPRSL